MVGTRLSPRTVRSAINGQTLSRDGMADGGPRARTRVAGGLTDADVRIPGGERVRRRCQFVSRQQCGRKPATLSTMALGDAHTAPGARCRRSVPGTAACRRVVVPGAAGRDADCVPPVSVVRCLV